MICANTFEMEAPRESFRGVFIPVQVLRLFQSGEISANMLMLLITIDSLVDETEGCWASNEYLGKKTHLEEGTVANMICKAKKMGLLRQVRFDGKYRYLETAWTRIRKPRVEENGEEEPDISRVNRRVKPVDAGLIVELNLPRKREEEEKEKKEKSRVEKKEEEREEEVKKNFFHGRTQAAIDITGSDTQEGTFNFDEPPQSKEKKKRPKKTPSEFDFKATDELYRRLIANGKVRWNWNRDSSAQEIRLMREVDGVSEEEIKKAILWYGEHMNDEYAIEAYSTGSFRVKYRKGQFTGAMSRIQRGTNDKSRLSDVQARKIGITDDEWRLLSEEQLERKSVVSKLCRMSLKEARKRNDMAGFDHIRMKDLHGALDELRLPHDFTDLEELCKVGNSI